MSPNAFADGVHGVGDAAVFDAGFEEAHCCCLKINRVEGCWVGLEWMEVVVVVDWYL
jgi:hypothetical protein